MRSKQPNPVARKKQYRLYSPSKMTKAFMMVKENQMSVRKASRLYMVPDTTLRDRVLGKVNAETAVFGKSPVLDSYEEANLVNHCKTMASYGYGYTRQECVDIATDYAVHLGKRTRDKPFTMKWMRGFLKRWPEIKVLKPRGLEQARAKKASKEVVTEFFNNLKESLVQHGLQDKPHLIYNIDEKGISIDHKPPYVVADSSYCPQAVTSGRGKTVTILGGGSASGVALPPYFVFPGQRMRQELLEGGCPGADGTVSETGWSNGVIFRQYLENHFLKFIPGRDDQKILLLLDGHRSHISVDLVQWAYERGIIIFILPAHTSHVLQPMDVACYGPFEKIYNVLCHKMMRESSEAITRYNVFATGCKAYSKALSPENIQSGFRRSGIFPLDPTSVPSEYLKPAEVFVERSDSLEDSQATIKSGQLIQEGNRDSVADGVTAVAAADVMAVVADNVTAEADVVDVDAGGDHDHGHDNFINCLFEKEKKLKKVKSEKKTTERKTMSKIVSGKELTEAVQTMMKNHESNQKVKKRKAKNESTVGKKPRKSGTKKKLEVKVPQPDKEKPGPSAINIMYSDTDSDGTESDVDPSELCCKCNRFQPEELRRCTSLVFTKWAQCDSCSHWVHLIYCTPVRVVRRGDSFLCHHCQ